MNEPLLYQARSVQGVVEVGRMMREVVVETAFAAPERVEHKVPRFFDREMVELVDAGARVSFFHLSERTVVAIIRERDGWETVGTWQSAQAPALFNPVDAKYRALYNALKNRQDRIAQEGVRRV